MLTEIGSIDNVPAFLDDVKAGKGRLMGFGHRVYKNYDPRATIIKQTAYDVFEVTGKNPLLDIALKLEEAALSDEYFVDRKLYPNVDFYSGLIYQALGFPVAMFTVLFAIPRIVGLAGALAGAARRQGPEDQPPAPVVHRPRPSATTSSSPTADPLRPTDDDRHDRTVRVCHRSAALRPSSPGGGGRGRRGSPRC